jgi:hypothetical protein
MAIKSTVFAMKVKLTLLFFAILGLSSCASNSSNPSFLADGSPRYVPTSNGKGGVVLAPAH